MLATDEHRPYLRAAHDAFGADIDYGILINFYGSDSKSERRSSPPVVPSE